MRCAFQRAEIYSLHALLWNTWVWLVGSSKSSSSLDSRPLSTIWKLEQILVGVKATRFLTIFQSPPSNILKILGLPQIHSWIPTLCS